MSKTHRTRPITAAVRVPDASARPLLRKAATLARSLGAPLRIVHVVAFPHTSAIGAGMVVRAAKDTLNDRKRRLQQLARDRDLCGIRTIVCVRMDYPVADALIRDVLQHRPRMLIVQSHRHTRMARVWGFKTPVRRSERTQSLYLESRP